MLPREWRMCIYCVQVSPNPMTGVIIYISVKRFDRAFGPERRYIRNSYYYYYCQNSGFENLRHFTCRYPKRNHIGRWIPRSRWDGSSWVRMSGVPPVQFGCKCRWMGCTHQKHGLQHHTLARSRCCCKTRNWNLPVSFKERERVL